MWLLGFYFCSAAFNLVLFGFLRDRIHVWYALYVALATLFLLMEDGLAALVLPGWAHRAVWATALRDAARLRIRDLHRRNALSERLIQAQEGERDQLAQELHDALGPGLMAVRLALRGRALREGLANAPAAAEAVRRADALATDLHAEVRTLSHGWQPANLARDGLAGALGALAAAANLRASPHVQTHFGADLDADLPPAVQLAAYRIAAELLHNALRHAHAATVLVQVLRFPDHLLGDGRGRWTRIRPRNPGRTGPARRPYARGLRGRQGGD